ncbi:MAG: SOS response-associated peptidase [Rhodobacteraceae bacterium]|nr:SOS response-associated peptidase [Paracoccaceae bacterium]
MCGRFVLTLPVDAMARLFQATPSNDLPEGPNFNICPTTPIAVVTSQDGQRRLRPMRWGFVPGWYDSPTDGPLLINARAETVATKPAFAQAARQRRCLVPASGFYEWSKDAEGARLPWYIQRADAAPLAFAAIWQDWEGGGARQSTCALLTTQANEQMRAIHDRMPVIVDPGDWPLWLGEAGHGAARLMRPAAGGVLRCHRVGRAVNSNRASGAELIAPIAS